MSPNIYSYNNYYYMLLFLLWFISTLVLRSIFYTTKSMTGDKKNIKLPPSPPSLPLVGNLHHLVFSGALYKALHNLSALYGPLLYLRLGASRLLLVSSSSLATEIFKTHDVYFSSRPPFAFADKILYGNSGFINAPYGDYWRFMKKLCVYELLATRQLDRSRHIRNEERLKFLEKMVESARRLEAIDVGDELVRLANNVTCRMTMSTKCSSGHGGWRREEDEAEKVRELVKESFALAGKLYTGEFMGPFKKVALWLFGKKAAELTAKFDDLLERIVKEHEDERINGSGGSQIKRENNNNNTRDLMDMVLDVYKDENAEIKITRENMKAFFIDLIVAGTDTSSQTMQWVLAELINHPKAFRQAREEILGAVGAQTCRLVDESDIPNLPYLQAVVKETLRLHPTGPVTTRLCRQPCKIGGYDIPEGTPVAVNLYTIMRDPQFWDSPDEFRPERFLVADGHDSSCWANKEKPTIKGQDFNYIPFGAGRRGCPGTLVAFALMNSTLAAAIQCFDWKAAGDHHDNANKIVDMTPGRGMSLGMANPLKCLPSLHFNPFPT